MSPDHYAALIEHAREEAPNECCGYVEIRAGEVVRTVRATNERRSPYGFTLDSAANLELYRLEEDGGSAAVYHSHPRSAAEPSQQDINLARYDDRPILIVSLAGEPHVRAWHVDDRRVEEEPIEVA